MICPCYLYAGVIASSYSIPQDIDLGFCVPP